jgi:hypothetical protein
MPTLNIQVFVDVVALLSGAPTTKAVHMFDDGGLGSARQGTPDLVTAVLPGQLVRWTVNAVDVQTQVWLKDVVFGPVPAAPEPVADETAAADADAAQDDAEDGVVMPLVQAQAPAIPVWGKRFEGYVPFAILPDLPHVYHLKLAFASGTGPTVTVDGPALRFVIPHYALMADAAASQIL